MKRYVLGVLALAAIVLPLHYLILLSLRSPVPAEYWLREMLVVKTDLGRRLPSPKIVFAGGSATLFGIDAAEVQQALGRPTLNDGFHAGMRLDDLFAQIRQIVKPGDVLVLGLEPAFYWQRPGWDTWQVRNALAWNAASFDARPLAERARILWQGGSTDITQDLLTSWLEERFAPGRLAPRYHGRLPPEAILSWYRQAPPSPVFQYSVTNMDSHGDMLHTDTEGITYWNSATDVTWPDGISPDTTAHLKAFAAEMTARQVRLFVIHTPYIVDGQPNPAWRGAEVKFRADLAALHLELLDHRDELFFPREDIFDSQFHLNARGREIRTQRLIADLRARLGP